MSVNPNGAAPPLAGVRVLAFTQLGAGPYAMTLLADLGADVVKVEDPTTGGDEARRVPPFNEPAAADGLYYQALNRGARSLTLNLRAPEGRELLHRLVARADAVYTNLRGDLPAKLGLDYAALRTANSRVVCCTLSGFGRTGPRAGEPGYDFILQAYAGFMSVTGDPDVSLFDAALSMLNYLAVWTLNRDWRPARLPDGAHQSLVPSQRFPTRDGWVVVMCMKEKFWERLVDCLELGALRDDPRFRSFADRLEHRDALVPLLARTFGTRTTAEWLARLRGRVPVAPVHAVEEALADEQTAARQMVVDVPHPLFGTLREVGCPIKMSGVAPRYRPAAPLGSDTPTLLGEIGVAPAEVERLRARGVV